jgi:hypothetical protein
MPFDVLPFFSPVVLGSGDIPHDFHRDPSAPQPSRPQLVWSSSTYIWKSSVAYGTPGFRWPE